MEVINDNHTNTNTNNENKENFKNIQWHEEFQYLDQIRHIFNSGTTKSDRTGVGTKSVFGHYSRYSLRDSEAHLSFYKVFILIT